MTQADRPEGGGPTHARADALTESALAELAAMGRALGGLRWVQGPGGNCSVKVGGELWVKASGTRFAEVAEPGGHAKVGLALARSALAGDVEARGARQQDREAAERELFARTPRPSLETYFHALGGRVVAHTHALGALLYACSSAPFTKDVGDLFPGAVAIPYVRPGRGVAVAVREVLGGEGVEARARAGERNDEARARAGERNDEARARAGERNGEECVCVLRSHGIIAYAESAARAIALTEQFDEAARARAEQAGPLSPFEPLAQSYLDAAEGAVEGGVFRALPAREPLEVDPPLYLFPDAPVCASAVFVDRLSDPASAAARALAQVGRACVLVDPAGKRVATARSSAQLRQTCEVAAAHDWLEDALRARGIASYLPADEPAHILSMPSEQYRIRLNARGHS